MSKKDLETLKLEKVFQNHSLDNLVFGSRSRAKASTPFPSVNHSAQRNIPAQTPTTNQNKKATLAEKKKDKQKQKQTKQQEKKRQNQTIFKKDLSKRSEPKKRGRKKKVLAEVVESNYDNQEEQKSSITPSQNQKESSPKEKQISQQSQKKVNVDEEEKEQEINEERQIDKEYVQEEENCDQSDGNNDNDEANGNCTPSQKSSSVKQQRKRKKQRRTKGEALKKFTMMADDSEELYPQESLRKRKQVGTAEKEYSLNRIFRKTQKVDLPSVHVDVNLFDLSFQEFIKIFGTFDIIHSSLPLHVMIQLPSLKQIIHKGFIFIWVEKGEIQMGYHLLNRWGFDVIDQIMWVKTNEDLNQLRQTKTDGQLFSNCRSTCLIGYKCILGKKTEYCTKISNNLIFAPVGQNSLTKPQQIYEMCDLMMPGARKLEIGGREIGGWLTMHHREKSLMRCWKCLSRSKLNVVINSSLQILCECCFEQKKKIEENSCEEKIFPIKGVQFQEQVEVCPKCENQAISLIGLIISEQKSMISKECVECFEQKWSGNEKQGSGDVKIVYPVSYYFPSKTLTCTSCTKKSLKGFYFECSSSKKERILCEMCFWQKDDDNDWKFKPVYQPAQSKIQCSWCTEECLIPYWACQVCQNIYWCGRCVKTNIDNHAHTNEKHQLYLVV